MALKILWQDIFTEDVPIIPGMDKAYREIEEHVFKKVARKDTQIELRHLKRSTYMVMSPYLELINTAEVVKGVIDAEKDGFDAVIIGCGNDPGLYQARGVLNIPVIGPTETAMHLACMLGSRFAIVTIIDMLVPVVERNLRLYGLENRAIARRPVRSCEVGFDFPAWFEDPQLIIPPFEKIAQKCIEEGAEVIVVACCGLGPALTKAGYREVEDTGVPVIDVASAAIKMAELQADMNNSLGISTSKHLTYRSTAPDIINEMTKSFT